MYKKPIIYLLLSFFSISIYGQSSIKGFKKISNTSGGLGNVLSYGSRFANRMANMGDLNGDGVTDIAVGEEYSDDGGTDKGAVWILFLKSDGSVKSKQKISETSGNLGFSLTAGTRFGFAVANIGDLNGDGVPELAVGSVVENYYSGAVWILYMKNDGTVKSSAKIDKYTANFTSLDNYDLFGMDIVSPGDINGDGVNDIVVGSYMDDDGGTDRGAVYVIFLKSTGAVKGYQKISSTTGGFSATIDDGDQLGTAVSKIGDLDADGVPDIVIGAALDDDGATDAGAVYIVKLNSNGTVKSYSKISNTNLSTSNVLSSYDVFGRAVAETSDKNGDGIDDIIVGAEQEDANGYDKGAVYIIYLNSTQGVKGYEKINCQTDSLLGYIDSGDKFGGSVLNLDNFAPGIEHAFASGAIFDGDGYTDAGAVYIIFLKSPATPDVELSKVTFQKDSICPDSFTLATVYLKNVGGLAVQNPKVTFVIESDKTITQKFNYSGSVGANSSVTFNVKLNLYNTGANHITAYYSGIVDTVKKNDTFRVAVEVLKTKANFTAVSNCLGSGTIFTNTSEYSAGDSLDYVWDFGDSTYSTDKNPVHIYKKTGAYKVILLATSRYGCTDTISHIINVYPLPKAFFATNDICISETATFTDSSIAAAERTWYFGDSSISKNQNPTHKYLSAGNYTVLLVVKNSLGCVDSFEQIIKVKEVPKAIFSVHDICVMDSLQLADSSIGATSWLWKFGDDEESFSQNPTHKYRSGGNFRIQLFVENGNGCMDSTSRVIHVDSTCVWPGDANADKVVDNNDILAIGLAYGDTGTARTDTSTSWKGNLVKDWSNNFSSGANYKHADSDGDGVVSNSDTFAVTTNYTKTHFKKSITNRGKNTDPLLKIDIQKDSLKAGDTLVTYILLGENALPAKDVYGLAFSLNYNQDFFNANPIVDFSDCWLGNNLITFSNSNNKLDFAVTRTDKNNTTGFGKIVTIKLLVKKDYPKDINQLMFEITDNLIISANESVIPVNIEEDSIKVIQTPNGISYSNKNNSLGINLYPNPGTGIYNLVYNNAGKEELNLAVYTIEGKKVWTGTMNKELITIDLSTQPNGMFLLKAQSKTSQNTIKIIKQ